MDTLTFHYIAYFAIIFRGRRIFKVMNLTGKYLDKIYNMAQDRNMDYPGNSKKEADASDSAQSKSLKTSSFNDSSPQYMARHKNMTASQFEKRLIKNERKKEKELYDCREQHYIKLIVLIITFFALFGILVYLQLDPFFMFMPIYRSDSCRIVQI